MFFCDSLGVVSGILESEEEREAQQKATVYLSIYQVLQQSIVMTNGNAL